MPLLLAFYSNLSGNEHVTEENWNLLKIICIGMFIYGPRDPT